MEVKLMSRIKTSFIPFIKTHKGDIEKAQKAIEAVQEVVRVSRRVNTSKVDKAKAAYIKAIDDAIHKFSISK